MKYVIVCIDEPPINVTLKEPDPILINYNQVQLVTGSDGGDGTVSNNSRVYTFTNADLAPNGSITFFHTLDRTFVDYSVFHPDVGEVVPDGDNFAFNSVTVNLLSFMPIPGLWSILIEV